MTWVPKLNARKLFPQLAPRLPPHPFFRVGSPGFDRALAICSQAEEQLWTRFGVAQFTPDDPRLAFVDGGDLASVRQGILRYAANRFPDGIVCLTTALFIHDLTDRCGPAIWMWGTEPPIDTSGLQLFTADPKVFATGHAPYSLQDGISARVTSPARSIVDCFSWHEFIGGAVIAALVDDERALRKLKAIFRPLIRNMKQGQSSPPSLTYES
jgi:hypothetical protein